MFTVVDIRSNSLKIFIVKEFVVTFLLDQSLMVTDFNLVVLTKVLNSVSVVRKGQLVGDYDCCLAVRPQF